VAQGEDPAEFKPQYHQKKKKKHKKTKPISRWKNIQYPHL
jgi:hypothetical protein